MSHLSFPALWAGQERLHPLAISARLFCPNGMRMEGTAAHAADVPHLSPTTVQTLETTQENEGGE